MDTKSTSSQTLRPPIVVVLGHVDHGKTTLLDNIRETHVQAKEAGGITQSIGASVITNEGKNITFIDTPGHAAFSKMRSRGARLADIAILVVGADAGVKPQTKEALEYILNAGIPYIVAATKTDLPASSIDTVQSQLEKEGVLFEGRGGSVPLMGVSGKTGKGVKELLEMITLVAELNEIKGNPEASLEAVIIETGKDKRGPTGTVVVREGTIKVGDDIVTEKEKTKVRGLFDSNDQPIRQAFPGEPALVLGFKDIPPVGSRVWNTDGGQTALKVSEDKKIIEAIGEGQIPVIIKAQNAGSLEAVVGNTPQNVVVVHSSVGDVTESDIFLAKSSNAPILAFESRVSSSVRKLAENEGVMVDTFNIIYELFEKLEELLKKGVVQIAGKAQILAVFPYDHTQIAGCKILQGKISKKDSLIIMRNDKELGKVNVVSLKRGKQDIEEAKPGEECGVLFRPQLDFKIGDVILAVQK